MGSFKARQLCSRLSLAAGSAVPSASSLVNPAPSCLRSTASHKQVTGEQHHYFSEKLLHYILDGCPNRLGCSKIALSRLAVALRTPRFLQREATPSPSRSNRSTVLSYFQRRSPGLPPKKPAVILSCFPSSKRNAVLYKALCKAARANNVGIPPDFKQVSLSRHRLGRRLWRAMAHEDWLDFERNWRDFSKGILDESLLTLRLWSYALNPRISGLQAISAVHEMGLSDWFDPSITRINQNLLASYLELKRLRVLTISSLCGNFGRIAWSSAETIKDAHYKQLKQELNRLTPDEVFATTPQVLYQRGWQQVRQRVIFSSWVSFADYLRKRFPSDLTVGHSEKNDYHVETRMLPPSFMSSDSQIAVTPGEYRPDSELAAPEATEKSESAGMHTSTDQQNELRLTSSLYGTVLHQFRSAKVPVARGTECESQTGKTTIGWTANWSKRVEDGGDLSSHSNHRFALPWAETPTLSSLELLEDPQPDK